jgi:ABC-2 type transport system ATP-binding protein
MIAAEALSKRYGAHPVVDRVSFELAPGQVAGLVGRGGAGKSTVLRMVLGLVRPSSGSVTVLGQPYRALDRPARQVGAALEPAGDPEETVAGHLRARAALAGATDEQARAALARVELAGEGARRVGELCLGARRRLALAGALLADPEVVVLDEPTEGLDVDAGPWLHALLRALADARRTVLVAGRDVAALAPALDTVLVLEAGRLVGCEPAATFAARDDRGVLVRSPGAEVLGERLDRAGVEVERLGPDVVRARGVEPATVGRAVQAAGVPVEELRAEAPDPERAFLALTAEQRDVVPPPDGPPGGGASDDDDTHRALADLEARLGAELEARRGDPGEREPRTVALLAAGRGQGRSTLAFLLADVLARRAGRAPLVVGLGAGPVAGLACAAEDRSALTLADLLRDLPGFDALARLAPYCSRTPAGVALLAGPPEPDRLADLTPREVQALLAFAGRFHDLVVLDVDAPSPAALQEAIARSHAALLVGAPDATDLLLDSPVPDLVAELHPDPPLVVVNRTEAVGPPLLAALGSRGGHLAVPFDRALVRALDEGEYDPAALAPASRVAVLALGAAVARSLG